MGRDPVVMEIRAARLKRAKVQRDFILGSGRSVALALSVSATYVIRAWETFVWRRFFRRVEVICGMLMGIRLSPGEYFVLREENCSSDYILVWVWTRILVR